MADLNINIGGDASGALAAVAAAEAALAGLSARRVCVVDIEVRGAKEASAQLAALSKARDSLGGNIEIGVSGGDRLKEASKQLGSLNKQMDRATQLGDGMRDLGGRFDELGKGVASFGQSSEQASAGMGQVNRQFGVLNRNVARSAELGEDMDRFTSRVGGLGSALGGLGGGLGGGAGRGIGGAVDGLSGLGRGMSSLPGMVGPATSALTGFMKVTALSAVGSGLLTAGVGALGAGSALAVGGGAGILGLVGAGLTGGVLDLLEDKKSDPPTRLGQQLARIGGQTKQLARDVVEPYGNSLVKIADQGLKAATPKAVAPVREAFAEIGRIAQAGAPNVGRSIDMVADSFVRLTKGGAGRSFAEMFENLPALTGAVVGPTEAMIETLGAVADKAASEGVPAFARLTAQAGQFGSTILGIGASNLAPFLDDSTSMVDGVTEMSARLQTSGTIRSSMGAVTSVVNAVTGGLGDAAPQIKDFADTVTANEAPIRQAVGGIAKGMTGLGEAAVTGVAAAAPAIDKLGDTVQKTKPQIGGLVGDVVGNAATAADFILKTIANPSRLARVFSGGASGVIGELAREVAENPSALMGRNRPGKPVTVSPRQELGQMTGLDPSSLPWTGPGGPTSGGPRPITRAPGPMSARQELAEIAGVDPRLIPQAGGGGAAPRAMQFTGPGAPGGGPGAPPPAAPAMPNLPGLGMLQNLQAIQGQAAVTGQAVQGMGQQMTGGLMQAGQAAQAPQQQMQAMSQQMTQVAPAAQQMVQGTQQATQALNLAPTVQAQTQQLGATIMSAAPQVQQAGGGLGAAMNSGMAEGYTKTETVIDTIIRKHILRIIDIPAELLQSRSPSRVFAGFGESMPTGLAAGWTGAAPGMLSTITGGMSDAITAAGGSAVRGVASDRGLAVGYAFARSVITGADVVLKRSDFQAIGTPKLDSAQATVALGRMGMLGPAGAGASVWKNPSVNFASRASQPQTIRVEMPISLDGQVFRTIAKEIAAEGDGRLVEMLTESFA